MAYFISLNNGLNLSYNMLSYCLFGPFLRRKLRLDLMRHSILVQADLCQFCSTSMVFLKKPIENGLSQLRCLVQSPKNQVINHQATPFIQQTLFKEVVLLPLLLAQHVCLFFLGPYIVYMLRDIDILEDWTAIKKVFMMSDQPFNHSEAM